MGAPIGLLRKNLGLRSLRAVQREAAVVERPQPVNDIHCVPSPVAQHLHAVRAFILVQATHASLYFVSIKQFHTTKITKKTVTRSSRSQKRPQKRKGVKVNMLIISTL